MPLYEFLCRNCQNKFEKICASNYEPTAILCPQCGKNQVEKCFSVFAVNSKSSSGESSFRSSGASSGSSCSSCSSHNCSSCH